MNEFHAQSRWRRSCRDVCQSGVEIFQRMFWIVALPFRLLAAAWRFAVGIGVGIVRFTVDCFAAAFGLAIVISIGYGLARVLLYPLFHPR